MATLHDPAYRTALQARLRALKVDSPRQWGSMSPAQMLHHLNVALAVSAGELTLPDERAPLPRALMKFLVMKFLLLNMPWPKGAPTSPAFLATGHYDFESERRRCLELLEKVSALPAGETVRHPLFGNMTGAETARLQAKHLNHHLKQFNL